MTDGSLHGGQDIAALVGSQQRQDTLCLFQAISLVFEQLVEKRRARKRLVQVLPCHRPAFLEGLPFAFTLYSLNSKGALGHRASSLVI